MANIALNGQVRATPTYWDSPEYDWGYAVELRARATASSGTGTNSYSGWVSSWGNGAENYAEIGIFRNGVFSVLAGIGNINVGNSMNDVYELEANSNPTNNLILRNKTKNTIILQTTHTEYTNSGYWFSSFGVNPSFTDLGGTPAAGTNTQINIADVFKSVESMQINIGDTWKPVVGAQINIGDTWKTIF